MRKFLSLPFVFSILLSESIAQTSNPAILFLKDPFVRKTERRYSDEANKTQVYKDKNGNYWMEFYNLRYKDSVTIVKPYHPSGFDFGYTNTSGKWEFKKSIVMKNEWPISFFTDKAVDTFYHASFLNNYQTGENRGDKPLILKSVKLPVTWLENFKTMKFTDKILTLAYSARFCFGNILYKISDGGKIDTACINQAEDFEDGILENGLRCNMEFGGSLKQFLSTGYIKKDKAIKAAKEYAAKVATALKGIPVKTTKCGPGEAENCETLKQFSEDDAYVISFSLPASGSVLFFNETDTNNIFTITIGVYWEGGDEYKPYIEFSCK